MADYYKQKATLCLNKWQKSYQFAANLSSLCLNFKPSHFSTRSGYNNGLPKYD